jgi:hypothetical protein
VTSFSAGSCRCLLLPTGQFDMTAGVLFANAPKAQQARALERFGLVPRPIVFPVHPLLADTGAHTVLIDSGTTGDRGALTSALHQAGVDPASIAADDLLVVNNHFPAPGFGRVAAEGDGWRWVAVEEGGA